jgi:hypothetical protein
MNHYSKKWREILSKEIRNKYHNVCTGAQKVDPNDRDMVQAYNETQALFEKILMLISDESCVDGILASFLTGINFMEKSKLEVEVPESEDVQKLKYFCEAWLGVPSPRQQS